ncbi:hypothetical protein [Dactylosporangium sp. CA-139066]|uniref:hypothetical protein n=1 Tax=Dactylosporangium sp. CA-139066 TaxID=3239930 RepID=UPI003D8D4B67
MIPQSFPLYAVASGKYGADLFLVVGWQAVESLDAFPYLVTLSSSEAHLKAPTASIEHRLIEDEVTLSGHDWIMYFQDLEQARSNYEAAAAPEPGIKVVP